MAKVTRPEELMINCYARLRMATGNIASGLGVLALLWSTVVLLGGFVSNLKVEEFWYLTVLSFTMACRMVDIADNEMTKGIYLEEVQIISILRRQKWITAGWSRFSQILLVMVLVPKVILALCVGFFIDYSPLIILWVSVARLVNRNYGITSDDTVNRTKLKAALDIFYALVAFQSLVATYWLVLLFKLEFTATKQVASLTVEQGGAEKWGTVVVRMYYSETASMLKKDSKLPGNWNLIAYGVGLLQSPSGDEHLWGARLLDKLFDDENGTSSVRQELLSSRLSIQNLIGMIGWRGTDDNIESRERAARIVAHVASDLHITHFSGTLQSICSLLESCKQEQSCEPQIAACALEDNNPDKERYPGPEKKDQHGLESPGDTHMVLVPVSVQEQPGDEHAQLANSPFVRFAKNWYKKWRERMGFSSPKYRHPYESRGTKELIYQGLMILEGLTQDEVNCTAISKDQRLLSRITEPLRSHDFLSRLWDNTMLEMLSRSLTVLSRILRIPGDGCTRLRQELASNTEAVSNLMAVLETDSEGAQQLHGQAVEILTELALTSFTKPAFGESAFMLNKLCENLEIFVEEKDGNNIAAEPDREKALRLGRVRVKAGDALQRLLPFQSARIVKAAAKISKKDAIDRLTKLVNKTLSDKMGTTADGATRAGSSNSCATHKAGNQALEETDGVQPPTQGNGEQSKERVVTVISKQAFTEDMLFLAAAMHVVNVTSEQDFTRPSPEDEALAKKLMEILEVNKRSTAEFFRILKVTYQVVIPMIQAIPSCIKYLNEQNFKEALTEILETMNGRELPKFDVARVKKMKEHMS